jgi:hypothetical protein
MQSKLNLSLLFLPFKIASVNGAASRQITKRDHSTKSAALLAFIGLSMSGFSLKQLASKSPKKF